MNDEQSPAPERPLAGQAALVTGAGRGLGRAFAERLAALGYAVAVHGRREHGPAAYGEGSTLTEVAAAIGDVHKVDTRTGRFLVTRAVDDARMLEGGTLERIAMVDEVARLVDVFAGPHGVFVTGQVLRVDGGAQLWPA